MPPDDCLVFEDAPPGVAAARAAGARVIGVATTHPPEALAEAHAIVNSLADVHLASSGVGPLVLRVRPLPVIPA